MTRRIEEVLNLPSMADLIDENHIDETERYLDKVQTSVVADEADNAMLDPESVQAHVREMDEIHNAAMGAHKDAIDLAFNMEAKNAGSIMEPAARFLELAMKASQNKLDAKNKAMKMKMEREKLNKDLKKNEEEGIIEGEERPEQGYLADRNQLLAKLKEQNK